MKTIADMLDNSNHLLWSSCYDYWSEIIEFVADWLIYAISTLRDLEGNMSRLRSDVFSFVLVLLVLNWKMVKIICYHSFNFPYFRNIYQGLSKMQILQDWFNFP